MFIGPPNDREGETWGWGSSSGSGFGSSGSFTADFYVPFGGNPTWIEGNDATWIIEAGSGLHLEWWVEYRGSAELWTDYYGSGGTSSGDFYTDYTYSYLTFTAPDNYDFEPTESFELHIQIVGEPLSKVVLEARIHDKDRLTYPDATVQYIYDYADRLIGRVFDQDGESGPQLPIHTYFSYENGQIVLQFDGNATAVSLSHRYLWGPAVDLLLADENVATGKVLWPLADQVGTLRDIAEYNAATDQTTIANHRFYHSFGELKSETEATVDLLFGFTGRLFDEATGLQNNLHRWYDPRLGQWISEDPIGFAGDPSNLYRYAGNNPLSFVDPDGLKETVPAAEGRVAGRAIEKALERQGALTQQGIRRTNGCDGVVDAVQGGKRIEIGPASPTGLPAKAAQAATARNADVILYRQKGRIPNAGSIIDYVRLPYEKLKELQEQAKANCWTGDQIWRAAKRMGTSARTRVSARAAEYAGRFYRGGRAIITTGSRSFLGISPIDILSDAINIWRDPDGWKRKPAYLFPGMLIIPADYDDPFNPPMA